METSTESESDTESESEYTTQTEPDTTEETESDTITADSPDSTIPDLYGELPLYDTLEEFIASPVYVTRYEYEIINKLTFIQYALALLIALIFLLIFKKK